jgi:bifunctional non-homologous end joining protein LigD
MAAKSAAVQIEVEGPDGPRSVRLSSPDRVLWPSEGITKKDLAEYVAAVAPALLRALGDRPVSLERFPEGVDG